MNVRIGSTFTGAGALCELAVAPLLGGQVVWHCEFEPPTEKNPKPKQAAARVLAHRFPDTPNLGDITRVGLPYSDGEWAAMKRRADVDLTYEMPAPDWSTVEPVDVLTLGFPCTDVSTAGRRAGLAPDTRSGLWSHGAYAISVLRPELVVIENVRGLSSASAHSDVEPCPWCLGDGPDQPALRALGAVLGDLADLRYDAVWCGLRASDLGACHERFRFVIVAAPRNTAGIGWHTAPTPLERDRSAGTTGGSGRATVQLLPTPRATDGTKGGPNQRGSSGDLMLPSLVAQLLPTPTATNARGNGHNNRGDLLLPGVVANLEADWGIYEPAIRRHEQWLGRPTPAPVIRLPRNDRKLNPALTEWMMGWPSGWVTEVPGLTPNEALRVCGNGVVPQQMQAGIGHLLPLLFAEIPRTERVELLNSAPGSAEGVS